LRNFVKTVVPFIPALMSVCGGITMMISLELFFTNDHLPELKNILLLLLFLSSILVVVLLGFILSKTARLKFSGDSLSQEIQKLTQQVHYFRDIADILLRSSVWAPGLKEYIDEEFSSLNYFLVKEFYKGRSKLALEYIEEKDRYGETEILYLETKALLLNDPSKSSVKGYMNPKEYDVRMLKKWTEHKVGMGWNHYFGFKYNQFKEELDIHRVYERHQERILKYATQLDPIRYRGMGFSEELISKLGMHLSEEVLPQLLSLTSQSVRKVPKVITVAFILIVLLVIFGVIQPTITLLFGLNVVFGFISITVVVSIIFFLMLSIYPFVKREING
jgi:hypothetical protein